MRLRDRVVQNGRRTFSRWGRFPVEREEKRAAQLIPARRQPQATHGTYRGGVVGRGSCHLPPETLFLRWSTPMEGLWFVGFDKARKASAPFKTP